MATTLYAVGCVAQLSKHQRGMLILILGTSKTRGECFMNGGLNIMNQTELLCCMLTCVLQKCSEFIEMTNCCYSQSVRYLNKFSTKTQIQ